MDGLETPGKSWQGTNPSSLKLTKAGRIDRRSLSSEEIEDLVRACAVDSDLFARTFFPSTVRQPSQLFHKDMWRKLEGPSRLINLQVFRGGSKTTTCRIYTMKRIAYGLAHTILYIGKSEAHAIRSVRWIKKQIEYNRLLTACFGLSKGSKWQDVETEIIHQTEKYPIWLMGMGITGSVRGINQDDFRPDLIVLDDVEDEENTATEDQRDKIRKLIYGALKESLTPASESLDAKLVSLQTPQNKEDVSTTALKDPEWDSAVYGCWTEETKDFPIHLQESSWPERYSSKVLREQKEFAAARNQLSTWQRENECKLTSPETSSFLPHWLKFYELPPEDMQIVLGIDPVPPPSDIQVKKGLHGKDYEALAVVGRKGKNFYLLEYSMHRGHEPDWTVTEFFNLAFRWKPYRVLVEATAYQRTLAWLLKKAMEHQRRWFAVKEFDDRRKKFHKIVDGLNGISSSGHLYVKSSHVDFITQFNEYPAVAHDDLIEIVAICCTELQKGMFLDEDDQEVEGAMSMGKMIENENIRPLTYMRGCP